jgi:hypothetical protein
VGDVYNAEDVEKTLTGVTTSVARSGHPFAQVRPVLLAFLDRDGDDPATGGVVVARVGRGDPEIGVAVRSSSSATRPIRTVA